MKFALGIALLALAALAFADVGPAPMDMPVVVLRATINGAPVPDGTVAVLHCFYGDEEFMGPGGSYSCEAGVCTGGMYKLNPCAREGNATFEFTHESFARNYTTNTPMLIERGKNYDFNVSISTASGTADIRGEGTPQPFNPCAIIFVLGGVAAAALVAVKK